MRPAGASKIAEVNVAAAAVQPLGELGVHYSGSAPLGDAKRGRRQLGGRDAGDPVDQLVRLVDDQQVVFGQHVGVADGVDGQQGVVGDDDICVAGAVAGALGEAIGAERAAGHPDAFPRRHADLRPGSVRHPGGQFVPVARLGARRPLDEPSHVAPQGAGRDR